MTDKCLYCGDFLEEDQEDYCSMYCEISDKQGPEVDF